MSITDFINARASETYPEPRSGGHDEIIRKVCPIVAETLPPAAQILDVGCGQGPALAWFTEHGFCPRGIATNQDDLDACRSLDLLAADIDMHDLSSIANGCYDCVFARHVLEHSVAPFYVLAEFARILKPGGVLYVDVRSPDTPCEHELNRNHYSVLGWKMWASLMQRAGFTNERMMEIKAKTPVGEDVYFSFIATK